MYDCYGQLFENEEEFKKHLLKWTKETYSALIYLQEIDEKENNYLQFKAPDMSKKNYKLDY